MGSIMILSFAVPIIITVVVLVLVLPRVFKAFRGPTFKGQPVAGAGQVMAIQPTGGSIQRGGMPPAYSCQIAVRVQLPGQAPYDATVSQYVDSMLLPNVQPGNSYAVQVDSANPQNIHIEFRAPIAR